MGESGGGGRRGEEGGVDARERGREGGREGKDVVGGWEKASPTRGEGKGKREEEGEWMGGEECWKKIEIAVKFFSFFSLLFFTPHPPHSPPTHPFYPPPPPPLTSPPLPPHAIHFVCSQYLKIVKVSFIFILFYFNDFFILLFGFSHFSL